MTAPAAAGGVRAAAQRVGVARKRAAPTASVAVGRKPRKPSRPRSTTHALGGSGRRVLMAEFVLCIVIVAFSPLTDKHRTEGFVKLMKRNTAIAAFFLILALVSTGGRSASRICAALGGLVTLALLVSDRDVFVKIAERFGADPNARAPAGPPGDGADPPPGLVPHPFTGTVDPVLGAIGTVDPAVDALRRILDNLPGLPGFG